MRVNAAQFDECIKKISDRGKMRNDEALDIINEVATRAEKMRLSGQKDAIVAAADALATELKESVARDRTDAMNNAMKANGWMQRVEDEGGIKNATNSVSGQLTTSNTAGRLSVQSRQFSYWRDWSARLEKNLRSLGLLKVAESGKLSLEIARELWELNAGRAAINPGSPEFKIAAEIHARLDEVRTRLNAAGARIGDALDYVMRTEHNPVKMRRAAGWNKTEDQAREAWIAKTEPRLDASTFDDVIRRDNETPADARKRFLTSVYNALVSGVHKTFDGQISDNGFFEGTQNLARRLSERKVLKWKDADAWHAHMQEFGNSSSLFHAVDRAFRNGGRALGLMESLGTNPRANFNLIMRMIEEKYRDSNLDATNKFKEKASDGGFLERQLNRLDGTDDVPVNSMAAGVLRGARTLTSLASLGGVFITHAASIFTTFPFHLGLHGINYFAGTKGVLEGIFKGLGSAERQEVLAQMGAFSNGLVREVSRNWQMDGDVPGMVADQANRFFRFSRIHWLFDRIQAASGDMVGNNLAWHVGKSMDDLPPYLKQMLTKYRFTPAEWDLIRKHGVLSEADGLKYLTPKATKELDPAAVEAHLRSLKLLEPDASKATIAKMVDRQRYELTDKLGSYYADTAAHTVITPGAREKAMFAGGKPGSFSRELMDSVMQFKMWPIAAATQMWGAAIHMSLSKKDLAAGIGFLFGMSTVAGMLKLWAQDFENGRPLRDPTDWHTLLGAFAAGGGGGIYADYVFGETNRMGNNALEQAGGPLAANAFTLWHIGKRFLKEDFSEDPSEQAHAWQHLWPDLAHWGVRQIPYANLFYLKGAIDYMLAYHLYEAASPGWWERTNQRLMKEQGRPMAGYEPGHGVPWTPWAVGYPTYNPHETSAPSGGGGGGVSAPTF